MTIKKKRTKIILPSILTVSLTCGLLLTGCQKTPDQSAVVSKAGGLSDDVIAEPLKDGETQTLDLPEHWDTTVTWSNDRGVFHADQKLESVTTGNLPVIEVSQKKLELEQLNGLISYFAGGEILYQTQELTREYYQNLLDRIKNREGFYADNSVEFIVEGDEDSQITVGLKDDTEYEVFIDGKNVGTMKTGLGGKLSLSVELEAAGEVPVKIVEA